MEPEHQEIAEAQAHLRAAASILATLDRPQPQRTAEERAQLDAKRRRAAYARLWNPRLRDDSRAEMLDDLRAHGWLPPEFDERDLPWEDPEREPPDPFRLKWVYEAAPHLARLNPIERNLWLMHRLARMTEGYSDTASRVLDLWDRVRAGSVQPKLARTGLGPPIESLRSAEGWLAASATGAWYPHYTQAVRGAQWSYANGEPVRYEDTWFDSTGFGRWGGRLGASWQELGSQIDERHGRGTWHKCHVACQSDSDLYALAMIELASN